MTAARWWSLVGFVLVVVGAAELWSPWAFVIGGALCLWLGGRTEGRNDGVRDMSPTRWGW